MNTPDWTFRTDEPDPEMYDIIPLIFGTARIVRLSDKGGLGLSGSW